MPSLSMRETLTVATPDADEQPAPGATAIVEAATAEEAIAEVHATHGADARIVEARRVLRGGIGGFFAKEHVQLHVAAAPAAGHLARRRPARPAGDDVTARATALIAELTGGLTTDGPGDGARTAVPAVDRPGTPADAPGATDATRPSSPVDRLLGADGLADGLADGPADGPVVGSDADRIDLDLDLDPHAPVVPGAGPAAAIDADQVDFGTYLRAQLAAERDAALRDRTGPVTGAPWVTAENPETVPVPAASVPLVPAPAPAGDPEPAATVPTVAEPASDAVPTAPADEPGWSATRLLHLGLPASLVHALEVADGADDLAWVTALAEALRPLCRPLPAGPSVLVGPDAPAIAEVADVPAARSRTWLAALGTDRWRHLVVGGDRWRDDLAEEPLAVSWTRPEDLPDALRCATELGLVLGYGLSGGRLVRARPLDVTLAVRELVDVR